MKPAKICIRLEDDKTIQCQLCNHFCKLSDGQTGICGVRKVEGRTLFSLVYGKIVAENIDPVEKKPIFHFMPGHLSYSISTVGCNLKCTHCQNADISQAAEQSFEQNIPGTKMTTLQVVANAHKSNCQSISYTYTEPTIFAEFALDCMKAAQNKGLKNIWVSNGYMSKKLLDMILPYLDAINIDLKFFNADSYQNICGAKIKPILDNIKRLAKSKTWLEITTLIIPGINDSIQELTDIAEFIKNECGADTPWHVSRFFPQYKMQDTNPTEEKIIYDAYTIGKQAGLNYVYGGNVVSSDLENTFCPSCNELIIMRTGYTIKTFDKNSHCPTCNYSLDIRNPI